MSWILEPWSSGPPYDLKVSYTASCNLLLERLGCAREDYDVRVSDSLVGTNTTNFHCGCGTMTQASSMLNNIIMDKFNDLDLRNMPIFSNPVYLSVPMSMCIILICGKLGAILAVYLKLPPIIGFLLTGLGIQNILSPMFLKGAGYPYPSPASEIKLLALIIVLMRAGLAIKFDEISKNSLATTLLSIVPYMSEFFAFMYVGVVIFGWSAIDMGLFASVMAPLGPSVVISGLLSIVAKPNRDVGYVPKQILISSPLEAVLAIVLFGIFSNLEQTSTNPLYPWVKTYPLYVNCLLIPLNIIFSTVLGVVLGYLVSLYINYRVHYKSDFIWVRISKNPQMGMYECIHIFVK